MSESKSLSRSAVLTITLAVLFALTAVAFTPGTSSAARPAPEEEIWVVVEPGSSCGNRTGSFDASFRGMPITVYFSHDRLKVIDGPNHHQVRPDRAYRMVCPPQGSHGPNRLTGSKVKVEGHWTSRSEFEAHEIYLYHGR
jgi:hypothetical protein